MLLGAAIAVAQPQTSGLVEPSAAPVTVATETVNLLAASSAGDVSVVAHGQGQDRVRLTIQNLSKRRLNVVVPPGMVAASTVGQGRGVQSMGLGAAANREGAFGEFRVAGATGGLQSIPATEQAAARQVAVPVGETIDVSIPAVCLNFGMPTPTARDTFKLEDVDDYTTDLRVRKALRSLATIGCGQGVAQAVMWRVCNDVTFEKMAAEAGKVINLAEISLASHFVDLLDSASTGDLVDASLLSRDRMFIRVVGEGKLAAEAARLNHELAGQRLLGLPVQVVEANELPRAVAPALFVKVTLGLDQAGGTRARMIASSGAPGQVWQPIGKAVLNDNLPMPVLDGGTIARSVDRSLAASFVTVKPARRTVGSTTLKVENRLPFTIVNLVVKAGNSSASPSVAFEGVGAGPMRSSLLPLQAATASLVESVEINGL
jgi:hypothetical protein